MRADSPRRIARGAVRHNAVVKNISEGGLLVELSEPIPVGRELEVTLFA